MRISPPKGNPGRGQLDEDARRELKKKRLCFTCQESWAPRHRCAAGKAHFIEVFSESSGEEDEDDDVEAGGVMQRRILCHLHPQEQEVRPLHLPEGPLQRCEEFPST